MLVRELREELQKHFKEKFAGIETDFEKYITNGLGFFPYGSGLMEIDKEEIPENGILILGQDFGNVVYFENIKENGEAEKHTMKNLQEVLSNEIKNKVFLSNVFMGLREKEFNNTEKFPGLLNVEYLRLCKTFLEIQIEIIKPHLIITLGKIPQEFLEKNINIRNQNIINIPHPSYLHLNIQNSLYKNISDIRNAIVLKFKP